MYLIIENLNFKYKNASDWIIDDLNLLLDHGEILSILGQSGSGKSTILRLISGLEMPAQGKICINDKVMCNNHTFLPPEKRGGGMVFQDYALFPHMTIEKNITFGLTGLSRKEKLKRVDEVLELVDLKTYSQRYPHELSGGQQQRIALARTIAPKPSLLLLDEPFSNLDAHLHEKIREELKDILHRAGITSVFVTHDQEDAMAIANKVIVLEKGKVIDQGTPEKVFNKK